MKIKFKVRVRLEVRAKARVRVRVYSPAECTGEAATLHLDDLSRCGQMGNFARVVEYVVSVINSTIPPRHQNLG